MADAYEMYRYYKKKRDDADLQRRNSEKKEEEYKSSKKRAESDLRESKKEKLNLEKRLEGVRKILDMLSGTGGLFVRNVPDKIHKSNESSELAGENFSSCIKCSDITAADIAEKFHSDSVSENVHSGNALRSLEAEERRLIDSIEAIDKQINQLDAKIDSLKTQINRCNSDQSALKRNYNKYDSEMRYYKRRMDD